MFTIQPPSIKLSVVPIESGPRFGAEHMEEPRKHVGEKTEW